MDRQTDRQRDGALLRQSGTLLTDLRGGRGPTAGACGPGFSNVRGGARLTEMSPPTGGLQCQAICWVSVSVAAGSSRTISRDEGLIWDFHLSGVLVLGVCSRLTGLVSGRMLMGAGTLQAHATVSVSRGA